MKNLLLAGASLLLLAAGCGSMTPMTRGTPCNSNPCNVTVTVTGCNQNQISATPDVLSYAAGKKGNIEWDLQAPPNWEFLPNGIEFKNPGNIEFDNRNPGARKFKWNNRHDLVGEHAHGYNIFVPPDGGRTICRHDPTILNY